MSSHEKRGGQSYPKHGPFYDYVFVCFFKRVGNEFQNLQVWSCNISWQSRLFVCLAGLVSLGQEGLGNSWNVAV